MKPSEKDAWERVRARGHTRFILIKDVLQDGFLFGAAITFGLYFYDLVMHNPSKPIGWTTVASFVFYTLVIGYAAGETSWKRHEHAYRKFVEN